MPDGYLPPVVVSVTGTDRDLVTTLEDAKKLLQAFSATEADATLGVNAEPAKEGIAEAEAELAGFAASKATATLGVNMGPYLAALAAARTVAGASAIKALGPGTNQATLDLLSGARTSVGASAIGSALGAEAGGKGGGGGGFFAGLLAAAGFGGGGGRAGRWGLGLLAGLPAMGTLGGLAGFSAEGVLGSLLGISGSIAGAGIGAGLLGLGAAGTMGVGMGTDMAGIGQAIGDVQKYRTALNSLKTAISTYGAASTQAAAAQQHLNFVLSGMPAVARSAIVALSGAITKFITLFDKATGPAEAVGAKILAQTVRVGQTFLSTIGMFALQNMRIIRSSLQPFFSWLRTVGGHGGLGIFTNLEEVFQEHLPTGMHAMEQGFELLAKTITIASGFLGGFLKHINEFLTRMNGATFGKWSHFVTDMIGLFNAWFPLVKALGKTLFELFKPAVGLGKQLAEFLTSLLGTFDKFLARKGTQSILHQLFTAHAGELIRGFGAVLRSLLPLLEQFLLAFVHIEAIFRGGFMVVLETFASVLNGIMKIPFVPQILGWVAALLLLSRGLAPVIGLLLGTNPVILAVIAGVVALGLAIDYLSHHWHQVWGDIKNWAADVWHFLYNLFHNQAVQDILAIWSVGLIPLAEHWHTVWDDIKRVVEDVWHAIQPIFHFITQGLHDITGALGSIGGGIMHGVSDVLHFFAEGGVVTRPTLAVVGESGPELVLPMSKIGSSAFSGGGVSPLPASIGGATPAPIVGGAHTEVNVTVLGNASQPALIGHEVAWQVARLAPGVR